MARSIMAVCVVCLLCAHRVPCQQHFDAIFAATLSDYNNSNSANDSVSSLSNNIPLNAKVFPNQTPAYENSELPNNKHRRHKRHGDHGAAAAIPHRPQLTEEYVQRLFKEYGENDGTINMNSFRIILRQLGLFKMIPNSVDDLKSSSSELNDSVSLEALQ